MNLHVSSYTADTLVCRGLVYRKTLVVREHVLPPKKYQTVTQVYKFVDIPVCFWHHFLKRELS